MSAETVAAAPWRAEWDPSGGYRIVYTPDPANPPRRAGLLHRKTFAGARRRVQALNEAS